MDKNVTSPRTVRELMDRYGIAPLKKYGQNFLIDGNIADKIANAAMPDHQDAAARCQQPSDGACALEIGPGLGALTQRLVGRAGAVAAYEIDAGLVRALSDTMADAQNFTLFHQDFLKADLETQLLPIFGGGEIYVAANLPYYITSPCIMKLVQAKLNIKRITVMMQREVAERICASPGGRDYGAISAAVQYFAQPKMLFKVSHECFYPKPDVTSAVLTLEMGEFDAAGADIYLKTVKGLFAKRRKTVRRNLRESFGLGVEEAKNVLSAAGIDENARAETLGVKAFQKICEEINNNSKKF